MSVSITFWGTRGTIPVPGSATARYGGNTPCLSVQDASGHRVILDAGTGIRELGRELKATRSPDRLDLFLSHVHWDHIQGLPFFSPMYADGQEVFVHGPAPIGSSLESVLERQLDPAVFPVPRAARAAAVAVRELDPGEVIDVPGFQVRTCRLSHPGGALGYRVMPSGGGPSVAYLTDNELGPGGADRVPANWRSGILEFLSGASLLVHDGMYTTELGKVRGGWGHSTALEAVALAAEAAVSRVALFHHDPEHDDGQLDGLLALARGAAPRGLTVEAAREGWTVTL